MVIDTFLLNLLASFIVGGFAVALATTIAERMGSKAGAILLSIPTNSLVAFFFIGLTNSIDFVRAAVPFSIFGMAINVVFISSFILLLERFGRSALAIALVSWFALALVVINFSISDLAAALLVFFLAYLAASLYFNRKAKAELPERVPSSSLVFVSRIVFAGFVISISVFLSKTLGPVWGGLFTMFPAANTSSFWILVNTQKKDFVASIAMKMLKLSPAFVFYTLAVYAVYPILGLYLGTVVCFMLAAAFAYALGTILG